MYTDTYNLFAKLYKNVIFYTFEIHEHVIQALFVKKEAILMMVAIVRLYIMIFGTSTILL